MNLDIWNASAAAALALAGVVTACTPSTVAESQPASLYSPESLAYAQSTQNGSVPVWVRSANAAEAKAWADAIAAALSRRNFGATRVTFSPMVGEPPKRGYRVIALVGPALSVQSTALCDEPLQSHAMADGPPDRVQMSFCLSDRMLNAVTGRDAIARPNDPTVDPLIGQIGQALFPIYRLDRGGDRGTFTTSQLLRAAE